nr:putative coat protein [Festuca pratensis amalgavirus 1]
MAANKRTFQSPPPTEGDYVAHLPEGEDARFVYYAKWVLTSYHFLPALFDPATYRVAGYTDKDFAARLRYFKGKEANVIDTIVSVGIKKRFFTAADAATFDNLADFLEFLKTPEGAAAVTEDLRRARFQAAGKGVFTAVDIAAVSQLTVQVADLEQHKARMIAASQKRIDELELKIAKERESLETKLAKSGDEFYPASIYKKPTAMKLQRECLVKAKAADPALAAADIPTNEQIGDALKNFREEVERTDMVNFLNQQDRLPRLREYVGRKILSFRACGKRKVSDRLQHVLAAMDGQIAYEIPAGGAAGGDDNDSDGDDYYPEYEGDLPEESSGSDDDSGDEAPESPVYISPLQTRGQRAKRGRHGPSSAGGGSSSRARQTRRA